MLPQAFERDIRADSMGAALGIKASGKGTDFMEDMGQTATEVGSPLGQHHRAFSYLYMQDGGATIVFRLVGYWS